MHLQSDDASVRPAGGQDAERILDLWCQLSAAGSAADARYSLRPDARATAAALINRWLGTGSPQSVFVAEIGRDVVGFITARPGEEHPVLRLPPTLVITDAVVDTAFRRKGVGRELVDAVRRLAQRDGFTALEVGTLAVDDRAVAFWRSMGFGDWRLTLHSSLPMRPTLNGYG